MSAGTEAFISTFAAAVAAVATAAALVVAVIALIVARRTLREARRTTEAQRETLRATEAVVAGTGKLVSRVEESTLALHMILVESQATRGLELLQEIAHQMFMVKHAMQGVRESAGSWHAMQRCEAAPRGADRRPCRGRAAGLAAEEIRLAIEQWRLRLVEVATQTNAQPRRLALASEPEP